MHTEMGEHHAPPQQANVFLARAPSLATTSHRPEPPGAGDRPAPL